MLSCVLCSCPMAACRHWRPSSSLHQTRHVCLVLQAALARLLADAFMALDPTVERDRAAVERKALDALGHPSLHASLRNLLSDAAAAPVQECKAQVGIVVCRSSRGKVWFVARRAFFLAAWLLLNS